VVISSINSGDDNIIDIPISELKHAWKDTFGELV
jgi:hypothetical protein